MDALAKISGLPRAELSRIWEEVKANQARLDACTLPHAFEPVPEPKRALPRYHVCTRCQGRVDVIAAHWYARGLVDGRLS